VSWVSRCANRGFGELGRCQFSSRHCSSVALYVMVGVEGPQNVPIRS